MCEERTRVRSGKTRSPSLVNKKYHEIMTVRGTYENEDGCTERDQRFDGRLVERVMHGFRMRVVTLLTLPRFPLFWRVWRAVMTHELELVKVQRCHTDVSRQHPHRGPW